MIQGYKLDYLEEVNWYMSDSRFKLISKSGSVFATTGLKLVLQDRKTGVEYLYVQSGYAGGLTVLVDKDGKPLVSPVSEYD